MAEPTGSGPPPAPQRRWEAPCPNCGAPVAFVSAAAAVAVCGYCRSTVVREGDALRKIGQSAELFDDHTPLQLGAGGRLAGAAFTLVGRLQYAYDEEPGTAGATQTAAHAAPAATWNEWYLAFDDARTGWLSEDNDQYVLAFDTQAGPDLPGVEALRFGSRFDFAGSGWQLASLVLAYVRAAEGELPAAAPAQPFMVADLRDARQQVATLDYREHTRPALAIGRTVRLAELELRGLREGPDAGRASLRGRAFACPACGAAVSVTLQNAQTITCGSCHSVIDLTQGIGAELSAVRQQVRYEPKIPLGRTGMIPGENVAWQAVGFSVRRGNPNSSEDRFDWQEYLLYNEQEGFAFLLDSADGWVLFRTLTGVPEPAGGTDVRLFGAQYHLRERYPAKVLYVAGEFYWKVDRGTVVMTADYTGSGQALGRPLSREETTREVIWSLGRSIPAQAIVQAFRLTPKESGRFVADARPISGGQLLQWIVILLVILFILFCLSRCDSGGVYYGGGSYGTAGSSYGGFSSGGGHK